jgi:hypothetical protein
MRRQTLFSNIFKTGLVPGLGVAALTGFYSLKPAASISASDVATTPALYPAPVMAMIDDDCIESRSFADYSSLWAVIRDSRGIL